MVTKIDLEELSKINDRCIAELEEMMRKCADEQKYWSRIFEQRNEEMQRTFERWKLEDELKKMDQIVIHLQLMFHTGPRNNGHCEFVEEIASLFMQNTEESNCIPQVRYEQSKYKMSPNKSMGDLYSPKETEDLDNSGEIISALKVLQENSMRWCLKLFNSNKEKRAAHNLFEEMPNRTHDKRIEVSSSNLSIRSSYCSQISIYCIGLYLRYHGLGFWRTGIGTDCENFKMIGIEKSCLWEDVDYGFETKWMMLNVSLEQWDARNGFNEMPKTVFIVKLEVLPSSFSLQFNCPYCQNVLIALCDQRLVTWCYGIVIWPTGIGTIFNFIVVVVCINVIAFGGKHNKGVDYIEVRTVGMLLDNFGVFVKRQEEALNNNEEGSDSLVNIEMAMGYQKESEPYCHNLEDNAVFREGNNGANDGWSSMRKCVLFRTAWEYVIIPCISCNLIECGQVQGAEMEEELNRNATTFASGCKENKEPVLVTDCVHLVSNFGGKWNREGEVGNATGISVCHPSKQCADTNWKVDVLAKICRKQQGLYAIILIVVLDPARRNKRLICLVNGEVRRSTIIWDPGIALHLKIQNSGTMTRSSNVNW